MTITVNSTNQAPTAGDDAYTVRKNGFLVVGAPGVLGNDTDPGGHALTAILVQPPSHGILWLLSDGAFLYIPRKGYSGTDTFTYQASDGQATSNVATVTLTIVPHGNDHGDGGDRGDGGDHRDGSEFSGAFAGVPVVIPDGLVIDQLAGTGGKKKG